MNKLNAFTIDVEDYFQVSAFIPYIKKQDWPTWPSRVVYNTERLLELLAAHQTHATFFVLGWIAERHPALIKKIVSEGHELACHGYDHTLITQQNRSQFHQDVLRSKNILEDIAGIPVIGYRAPSYSITRNNLWAFDVLIELGFRYSSSIYPIYHDLYGIPDAPRFAFHPVAGHNFLEVPITTARIARCNIPVGGGGYFRLWPYVLSKYLMRKAHTEGLPSIFYCHPWEIDAEQPRLEGLSLKTRFRHYYGLAGMQDKLARLLRDFSWGRMDQIFL